MSEESQTIPPNEVSALRTQIVAHSAPIAAIGKTITDLVGTEGKETERAALEAKRTKVEAELAKLEDKVIFSGTAKILQLVGPSLKGTLPSLDQLAARLNTELPVTFPLDMYTFDLLKKQCGKEGVEARNNVLLFLEKSTMPFPCDQLILNWLILDFGAAVRGQSKKCIHFAITPIVEQVPGYFLRQLGSDVDFSRNGVENPHCPDFEMHIKDLLVFRGAEKEDGVEIGLAVRELTSKMELWVPLFFGNIPYVIAYALSGFKFQLYALYPNEPNSMGPTKTMRIPLCEELNLSKVLDRIRLLRYMVNLVRVFEEIGNMVPPSSAAST
ncbi:hypothetical protein BASA81_000818 [Batrachochytrium salamandrivorans]|nr:hypothetical protein BASA81_000818 [Batrachochytrium salamandrivorans]